MSVFTNDFSEEIWRTTYKHNTYETAKSTFARVAVAIASVEKTPELRAFWAVKFEELLSDFRATTGGRIMSNAGTGWKGTTLMNCFVGGRSKRDIDSLDGILETLRIQAQTLKSEGGWGMNFSFIRPRGSFIKGIGVESPGSVKYMELFDKSSDIITAGSGQKAKTVGAKEKIRKGAMMGVMDVWHPDIEEFITAKLSPGRLSKFNLSVNCSNEFMEKVIEAKKLQVQNEEVKWDLVFPDTSFEKYKDEWDGNIKLWTGKGYPITVHKTVSILTLWDLIVKSTYERNDPGVLFLDRANETHCWNYGEGSFISATNPCGEQCLPLFAVCNLASLNLVRYLLPDNSGFDLECLSQDVPVLVRFLDNVNDYTNAPLPEYLDSIRNRRRIGLGVMGWGSSLYLLKIRFGSHRAEEIKRELMKCITHSAVRASIILATEKGMFSSCDPAKHSKAKFWEQIGLPESDLNMMAQFGIRNSALFSIQPTGNTSIFANLVSGGLEPVFMHEYIRTSIVNYVPEHLSEVTPKYWAGEFNETDMFKFTKEGDETILRGVDSFGVVYKIDKNRGLTKETLCEDYAVRVLKEKGEWDSKADWAVTTEQLSVGEHITDMVGFGRWIDSSMSKTVNVPNDYPFEAFEQVYIEAYQSGFLKGITTYRAGTMTTVLASAEKKDNKPNASIPKTIAPKRPKLLNGELYHFTLNKQRYYVAVGLVEGEPYEIFTGVNHNDDGEIYIPKTVLKGGIVKNARGKYALICEEEPGDLAEEKVYTLNNGHSNDTVDALTRIISTSLRHGADVSFIVHQLEKTKGPMTSFSKVLARTLKKYVREGMVVSGEQCPSCKAEDSLVRREGCKICKSCGYSACG